LKACNDGEPFVGHRSLCLDALPCGDGRSFARYCNGVLQASLGTPRPHTSASATQPVLAPDIGHKPQSQMRSNSRLLTLRYDRIRSRGGLDGRGLARGVLREGGSMDPATSALLTDLYQLNMM